MPLPIGLPRAIGVPIGLPLAPAGHRIGEAVHDAVKPCLHFLPLLVELFARGELAARLPPAMECRQRDKTVLVRAHFAQRRVDRVLPEVPLGLQRAEQRKQLAAIDRAAAVGVDALERFAHLRGDVGGGHGCTCFGCTCWCGVFGVRGWLSQEKREPSGPPPIGCKVGAPQRSSTPTRSSFLLDY